MWYNNSRSGAHGPIAFSTELKKHSSHLFAAKYQAYGINHAQSISCYAFLFLYKINPSVKKAEGFYFEIIIYFFLQGPDKF